MSASGNPRIRREMRMFEDLNELATDLAEYISQLSENSVKERGVFSIALTGGTLVNLLRKLCEAPYTKTVDWTKWYVFWADERAVSKSHADSNYKLTKDGFLSKVYVINSHMHSINDKLTVDEAAREYEFVIRQLVKVRTIDVSEDNDCPKFDLILLEMGPDGHVASLFPENPALEQKEEWVTYITNSPESPPERITFTLPVINSASNVAIVATGEDKADAVCLAVAEGGTDEDCDGSLLLPAGMVRPTEGKLVWFLDNLAASALDGQ